MICKRGVESHEYYTRRIATVVPILTRTPMNEIIRTVIADDHPIFVSGLRQVLQFYPHGRIQIVGTTGSGKDLIPLLTATRPDLLMLDLNLEDLDGLQVLSKISSIRGTTRIVALTMYDDPKLVKKAFKSGVDGYCLKSNNIEEVYSAITEVRRGETYMGTDVLLTSVGNRFKQPAIFKDRFIKRYHLTKREVEVLNLIAEALSNKQIGKELYISDQTVSVHRKNIMRKLGVSNTAALIKMAYDFRLVENS